MFLIVPAALLGVTACVGYLRRWQREVYDYLSISRCRVFGQSGLHELRLPADYILGLFLLGQEGGSIGKFIARIVAFSLGVAFVFVPVVYIVKAAAENLVMFGVSDLISLAASAIAIILSLSSIVIVHLAGRINP